MYTLYFNSSNLLVSDFSFLIEFYLKEIVFLFYSDSFALRPLGAHCCVLTQLKADVSSVNKMQTRVE